MKGIHVIAIAFLASCTVITANENVGQKSVLGSDGIPTVCPYPTDEHWWNTTTNLPHETDCTKFYKCTFGKPILQDCPLMFKNDPISRLHYNRLEQVCDWPWRAGCESCPTEDDTGILPPWSSRISNRNDNCNSFWECPIRGQPRLGYCEYGKCFSRTCQECVSNRNGGLGCDGRPGPGPGPGPGPINCEDGQRKSHRCNCFLYFKCIDDDWIRSECPGGLLFDNRTGECVLANEARCERPGKLEGDE